MILFPMISANCDTIMIYKTKYHHDFRVALQAQENISYKLFLSHKKPYPSQAKARSFPFFRKLGQRRTAELGKRFTAKKLDTLLMSYLCPPLPRGIIKWTFSSLPTGVYDNTQTEFSFLFFVVLGCNSSSVCSCGTRFRCS